ncbi:hypothetical protein EVAR_36460_1 [Eumeta japonica]|uniref:Uncharacterized protein n=1 Tax=Eumeta variegata TaxID=151549 RepID=A0A4C1VSE0_EUMVA|nr:hypothetical protein EVAR_36460_1 [Eumeta japonica]
MKYFTRLKETPLDSPVLRSGNVHFEANNTRRAGVEGLISKSFNLKSREDLAQQWRDYNLIEPSPAVDEGVQWQGVTLQTWRVVNCITVVNTNIPTDGHAAPDPCPETFAAVLRFSAEWV